MTKITTRLRWGVLLATAAVLSNTPQHASAIGFAYPVRGASTGSVTASGWIAGRHGRFDLSVGYMRATSVPLGNVTYEDGDACLLFTSTRLTGFVIAGTHAVVEGEGTADGERVDFRVDLRDGRSDTFAIAWRGYSARGVVKDGSIQIH